MTFYVSGGTLNYTHSRIKQFFCLFARQVQLCQITQMQIVVDR